MESDVGSFASEGQEEMCGDCGGGEPLGTSVVLSTDPSRECERSGVGFLRHRQRRRIEIRKNNSPKDGEVRNN